MSRFILVLCTLGLASIPVIAMSSSATDFRRPDEFRYAINSVIGDLSWVDRHGSAPTVGTDPAARIRTHLEFVHDLLARRDMSAMPGDLQDARRTNLARLRDYMDAGVFPCNRRYVDQNRPCFIDEAGRICAVGYLVECSAGRDVAERINASFQYAFLPQMQIPELDRWISTSGLSLLELTMIQPCYDPEWYVTVTQSADMTVTIRGSVGDWCCGVKYAVLDFGEVVWQSGLGRWPGVAIDASHTYSQPGTYMIKAKAISSDWCENQIEENSWLVSVGASPMQLSAVKLPGGPPYRLYLTTTDDVAMGCNPATTVQWSQYEPAQDTNWYFENGVYRTPVHGYDWTATCRILVENRYDPTCAMNQGGSITVRVDGSATPVEVSTWGRIKAMYARP